MKREEILTEINYQGEYNKAVKKKLNKLIKKYHPDYNKEDNQTIMVLYQVKKDLEEGKVDYYNPVVETVPESNYSVHEEEIVSNIFLKKMIDKLSLRSENINKRVQQLYDELNICYENHDLIQDKVNNINFLITEVKEELENITKVDYIDISIIILIIVLVFGSIIFKTWFLFIFVFLLVCIELYYTYVRYIHYNKKRRELDRIIDRFKDINSDFLSVQDKISDLRQKELQLKRERLKVSNDLQFYNYEMSKANDRNTYKDKKEDNNDLKNYGKR